MYVLAAFDAFSYALLLFIAFDKNTRVSTRKWILIFTTYATGVALLFYIGANGPGLLFLYVACVFGLLILHKRYALILTAINVFIVAAFAVVLQFDLSPKESVNDMTVGEWAALSVNVLILSTLSSMLIPMVFNGLSQTIRNKEALQDELAEQNRQKDALLVELKEKNEDLEQFAFTASHDLQEPLRMVTSFMGLLQKNCESVLDDKALKYIHFAADGARRMKSIISDLLDYSRASRIKEEPQEVDLNELIADYRLLRRDLIQETDAEIRSGDLPIVNICRVALVQVFNNLIDNAVKYCREGVPPVVHISVIQHEKHIHFTVRDDGRGIKREDFQKIFVIFQRLESEDVLEEKGTGLGLAVVKKIVERQNGKVWVESEIGEGTAFHFNLPGQII